MSKRGAGIRPRHVSVGKEVVLDGEEMLSREASRLGEVDADRKCLQRVYFQGDRVGKRLTARCNLSREFAAKTEIALAFWNDGCSACRNGDCRSAYAKRIAAAGIRDTYLAC